MMSRIDSALTVASLQMVSTPDLQQNLDVSRQMIREAAGHGARLVVLPEYFCMMGNRDLEKVKIAEHLGEGPIQQFLADQARENSIYLIAGTMPLLSDEENKVYNATLVFNPQGERIARYDKIHLFRFQKGTDRYDESEVLSPGRQPAVADIDGLKVGLSVCYDLRFPELYRSMGPVDIIALPAAFVYTTGMAHWEVLIRARAIENQCYFLSCGQGGVHANGRRTWGHSMWVNPWGEVENMLGEGQGIVLGRFDPAKINDMRTSLPALSHRVL
ncbi:MAG TPA: carbon-nitrogen hydrolase family protein [Limnobacter sp.]|nr:carbon-nitrogen hydrolase family protein [Limnobacter sp.]